VAVTPPEAAKSIAWKPPSMAERMLATWARVWVIPTGSTTAAPPSPSHDRYLVEVPLFAPGGSGTETGVCAIGEARHRAE
jgi:hypothetical protein